MPDDAPNPDNHVRNPDAIPPIHTPTTIPTPPPIRKGRSPLGWAVQIFGGLLGLACLVWAITIAFSPDNRPAVENLKDAPLHLVGALAGLTALAIALDGAMFWVALRSLRRENGKQQAPFWEVLGINAIATFLNPLPLKLGMIVRGGLHIRRHGLGLMEMISWFAGLTGLMLVAMGPLVLVSRVRPAFDGIGVALLLGLMAVGSAAVVGAGLLAKRSALLRKVSLGAWPIAADGWGVFAIVGMRALHLVIYAVRFWVIAKILGVALGASAAIQLSSVYAIVQASAPTGTLGVAEAVTMKVGEAALGLDLGKVALMVLVTTVAQTAVSGVLSLVVLAWLKPWRPAPAATGAADAGRLPG